MKILQDIHAVRSRKCEDSDMQTIINLIEPMTSLCHESLGNHENGALAIAHCQVDQKDPMRFFVVKEGVAVVNPVIIERKGNTFRNIEGCMSFAFRMIRGKGVDRYRKLIVSFFKVHPNGQIDDCTHTLVEGPLALIFQHEIDHMDGKHIFSPKPE